MSQQKEFHNLLKDMMYSVAQRRANATAISHIVLGLITAPLITMSISLQASLPQNRVTMLNLLPDNNTKMFENVRAQKSRMALLRF